MEFKSLSVVKYPVDIVWASMQNDMPGIADLIDDIESVTVQEKTVLASGGLRLVNIWKACPNMPDFITSRIKPEMLAWTDTADWNDGASVCTWSIKSHYFGDRIDCFGETSYEPAMGGRGTRITFKGQIKLNETLASFGVWDDLISKSVEGVVVKLIPGVFVKITKALGNYLDLQKAEQEGV